MFDWDVFVAVHVLSKLVCGKYGSIYFVSCVFFLLTLLFPECHVLNGFRSGVLLEVRRGRLAIFASVVTLDFRSRSFPRVSFLNFPYRAFELPWI